MKNSGFIVSLFLLLAFSACNKNDQEFKMQPDFRVNDDHTNLDAKKLKIAVLSDLHFMEPSLLRADGTAFQTYLMQDPKLLAESGAILEQIIQKLLIEKPDLVLISGDLTKDGELVSHKSLIKQLKTLELNHIQVLVVPGNHDISNPDAKLFNGDNAKSVPTITPAEFKALYAEFGYRNAVAKDPASLSYVSEPAEGLRILAIDANEYYNNTSTYCVVAGNINRYIVCN